MSSKAAPETEWQRRIAELERAHRRHRDRRYMSLLLHWLWSAPGSPRPVEVQPLPAVSPAQLSLTFIGHASVLIRYAQLSIAVDPMLGARLGRLGLIRRTALPGIRRDDLRGVDLVLITSTDPAHLHVPTLRLLPPSVTLVLPRGQAAKVADLELHRVLEIAPGQSFSHSGVDVHTTEVRGQPGLGFAIRGDGPTLFTCGRSGYGPQFREIGAAHRPDLAILPIGGYRPSSFRRRHLSPLDALYAFEDLRARILVPIHFGAFPLSYEKLSEPPRWLAELVAERELDDFVVPLAPGESRLFTNPRRARRPTPHQHHSTSALELSGLTAIR